MVRKHLASAVLEKIQEQIERTQHLLGRIPPGTLSWTPDVSGSPFSLGLLLGHLLECLGGFCAVLHKVHPEELAHFSDLRALPVNHECAVEEAARRIADYRGHIEEGFALVTDEDLARRLPTLFVPEGELVLTLLLGNLEHLINHKFQLLYYMKMLGVVVGTADLYRLRGSESPGVTSPDRST